MKHRDHQAIWRGLQDGEVEGGGKCGEEVGDTNI